MSLCSMCGGPIETFITPLIKTFDPNPYCSKCGNKKETTCYACNGKGYTQNFASQYCSKCGRQINTKTKCSSCNGRGNINHICTGY